ncbi:MAG: phosphatase PAP2 family protein [Planctomycetes bacterium]|nr:phosphatase PAP2 family protein [Planctomycetota bacterium]MCW8134962.1 phosphatase PAP2 family protein [Planctomycetota bacterium]
MPDTSTLADAPTGANQSVKPAELAEIDAIRTAASHVPLWRWAFRLFRFEEVIILGLLACFVTLYFVLPNTPSFDSLLAGFTYNFHGHGTMWMFTLWCAIGTAVLLLVAMLPLARAGAARKLMHGVWGEASGGWARGKATLFWGLGGLRAYVPFLACMGVYEMNKRLIPAIRGDTLYDIEMAQFDIWLLGDLSAALVHKWMHADWITNTIAVFGLTQLDIHEAAYISYVYAAPALALALWFLGRRAHYNRFIGALVICGALAYVGYVLVPVVGPKYVFENRWLLADSSALTFMDDIKARNRDCFPSLHTAWTTLFLIAAWKGVRPLFWVYLPVGIAVYIATFYGGYHYIPDIIAGHALAIFAWWAAKPLREWWDRRAGKLPELQVSATL